jgi:predicted GNAT family acetyltransferase
VDTEIGKEISKDGARDRYELRLGDSVVGEVDYMRKGDRIAITHTGVRPSHRGQGLAGELVEFVLRDLGDAELKVLPYCSYVSDFIARRPEYLELVPPEQRPQFGLGRG